MRRLDTKNLIDQMNDNIRDMQSHNHNREDCETDKKPNKYIVAIILVASILAIFFAVPKLESKDIIRGKVIKIEKESIVNSVTGINIKEQNILVLTEVDNIKREIPVLNDFTPVEVGDSVFMSYSLFGNEENFEIKDLNRNKGILLLVFLFIFLVILTSGKKGFYSLIGLIGSFAVIIAFIVPMILKGFDPIAIGISGSFLILLESLYVSYGFNKKSISALVGITITLILVGVLASMAVKALHFTGFSNEGALYLNMEANNSLNLTSLLITGIIIAAIGILDDVAITQASTVFNIFSIDPTLNSKKLFGRAMSVGKDHISAVVNTLILAYTGASLPLILLLYLRNTPVDFFISYEIVSEEIIRTLIASSGLLLAVPLTTIIAVFFCKYVKILKIY